MENLINCQKDVFNRISKAQTNFKKSPKDRISESYVETRLDNVEQLWVNFMTVHQQIIKEFKWEDIQNSSYVKEDYYDKTEESYVEYKSLLKQYLKSLRPTPCGNNAAQGAGLAKENNGSSSSVKLPKIIIPTFSGKYTEWISFRNMFISLVHNNAALDDVQRLHYLKGYLSGEAEQLIRQIPVTPANYNQCWQQLENRFNNKRYLANCILNRLFSQRKTNVESATALKELLDTTTDCLYGLKNLGLDVSSWDIIVIHIVNYKLDQETRKQWELKISADSSNNLPTFTQYSEFLQSRFRALECIEPKQRPSNSSGFPISKPKSLHVATLVCEFCSENHKLCFCKEFAKTDYSNRHEFVAKNRLCFNCLGGNHSVKSCHSSVTCRICNRRHHSLLHPKNSASGNAGNVGTAAFTVSEEGGEFTEASDEAEVSPVVSCIASGKTPVYKQVLLATALVRADTVNGHSHIIRALLDQGSQASFVTEDIAQYLELKKIPVKGFISGLEGNKNVTANYMVQLTLHSRVKSNVTITVQAYVLKSITTFLPSRKVVALDWLDINELQLADPQYHSPNKIDILLGAEIYGQIIEEGIKKSPRGSPIAQATSLGWIISGAVDISGSANNIVTMHLCAEGNDLLKRFWEIESDPKPSQKILTTEETLCETFYAETTQRDNDGRYIVRLPFKNETTECGNGDSRQIAVRRLNGLMSKFNKDAGLKEKYKAVIEEYLLTNHMEKVCENERDISESFYLPHHAVIRDDKDTTKVRIVFEASAKNKKGISLNDTLMIGPTLQPELRHLIMRWRIHKICLAADIIKMYRQVKVTDSDAEYQRIVWKNNQEEEVQDYRLKRVTFGTAAAPYLAVKTLQQVALDEGADYPNAAEKVKTDFYMDDLLTGCSSVEEGVKVYNEMNQLLQKGGFQLQKWMSNSEEFLNRVKQEKGAEEELRLKLDDVVKLLGLTWKRDTDVFKYSVAMLPEPGPVTKRKIISEIAKLYDPLGWAAPSVILAKVLIQKLWITGVDWDEEVPNNILKEWHIYRSDLPKLTEVSIPRWLRICPNESQTELHGFSDASKTAYAAAVYIRVINSDGSIHVNLVTAKTKVAPIKQISIPRLELSGAVLVTRLLVEVATVMGINKNNIRAWTDSTIVLAWLNSHPSKWQTFVANRVSEILTTLDSHQWSHVKSSHNPADCASRGMSPLDLVDSKIWFNGPDFLHKDVINYGKPKHIETHIEEIKVHLTVTDNTDTVDAIWNRFSSLTRLVRVVAYCRRFLNLRCGYQRYTNILLSAQELSIALETCIKLCQGKFFREEIVHIQKYKQFTRIKGPLKSLNPFIDSSGILRVGGRLERSQLDQNTKHPILLPKKSQLTDLIISDAHRKTLHGGPQLMLTYLSTKYYILSAKALVKACVRRCIKCIRYAAPSSTQLMGQLPAVRVCPGKPFLSSGVDYAGPIKVRTTKGRGHHATKGYICLFVCMATKAVHLEVVSDLTTEAFLASFKRFVSRRGLCTDIWSDNGTNFVGASRELRTLLAAENASLSREVSEYFATNGTTWHFIPPHSPNFGGIWEAGIKSTKFHLKRVIGDLTLTYEELSTVMTQIEACLNSRPLSRIDSDQDSIEVLTPGHFLVGGPLLAIPDYNFEQSNVSSLRRWQLTQRLTQSFWRRWSQEYLTKFLHRYKWSYQQPEPKIGDVVLIKEDDLPPCRWLLGRVVAKHPGKDNVVRVVTIRNQNSLIKRPTSKLCVLPVTA